jgi:hypothetical protein
MASDTGEERNDTFKKLSSLTSSKTGLVTPGLVLVGVMLARGPMDEAYDFDREERTNSVQGHSSRTRSVCVAVAR